jgi:archaellum component FlaF (FlaF/FlaG flagellin family)
MCRRKRKGVSTILGTLIFIGILFTAVIPMYVVMNQADTKYTQKRLERERLDEERAREDLYVIVYPTSSEAPDNITIMVENICELTVRIVRIWINDTIHDQESIIKSMSQLTLGSFDVSPPEGKNSSYDVRVTTDRGNVFESGSGPLVYDGWNWEVEQLMINVLISSSGIVFKIYITGPNDYSEYAQVWKIGGTAFKTFNIEDNGVYTVTVKRGSNIIHQEDVTMEWPDGPSVLWVYA